MIDYFKSLSIYKKGIWLYLFLLIFEGALRKWLFPQLASPLLLAREPIVIWLIVVGLYKGWLGSGYVKGIMAVSTLSLLLSLLFCHNNLYVGLYGWRIYFFHIPFIFVMARVLDRGDILMMGRVLVAISIPMTALATIQFYSPQSAWVNVGVGGEGSAGFSGAEGYFRPPGTFSFTSGYVLFQGVIGCLLAFYMFANSSLKAPYKIEATTLYFALGAYMVSIPVSISRTHFFQSIIFIIFVTIVAIVKSRYKGRFICFALIVATTFVVAGALGLMDESITAFSTRLEEANKIEGGIEGVIAGRYLGGLFGSLFNFDTPPLGYGMGIATNVGAKMVGADIYTYFNGENEWSRTLGECGVVLGWIIIAIRIAIALTLFRFSWQQMMAREESLLPWFLSASMLLSLPQGQMGVPTNLGFCIFTAGATFAALKGDKNKESR